MPRGRKKKELPPLEGNLQKTHLVQKSNPLFSLWSSDLALSEFKILDTYLSRINSHEPERRTVVFEKGELESLLGVTKISRKDLDTRLVHLQKTLVNVSNGKKIDRITLFERAQGEQDECGIWQVKLTCTPSAMKYVFNIEDFGYFRYRIRSITKITSLYSYILFTYLEYNRRRKSWDVSLVELKDILNCTADTYSQYYRFNDLILKKCQKEIQEKTECRFTYEPIKTGRRVTKIRFNLETISDILTDNFIKKELPEQITFEEIDENQDEKEIDYGSELANLIGESACDDEFSPEQVRVIQDLVIKIIPENDNLKRCDYVIEKMHLMNYYSTRNPIPNRFEYLKKMISNELKN